MLIRTESEAAAYLKSVHGFHDGFIRRIVIASEDSFEIAGPLPIDVAHSLTGRLDTEIEFAHHPTVAGLPASQATTLCRFRDVEQVRLDLRHCQGAGWALYEVSIKPCGHDRLSLHCQWSGQDASPSQRLFTFAELEVL